MWLTATISGPFVGNRNAIAVGAQVEHDPINAFLFEPFNERPAVVGALGVKAGQIDHAELFSFPVALAFNDIGLGELILQLYDIAGDGDHFTLLGARRDDGQLDIAAFFSANQLHHLVDLHVNYIGGVLVPGILDGDHLVIGVE